MINLASNFIFTIKQFQDIQGLPDNSASLTISSESQNLSPVPIECLTLAHGDDLDQANPYGMRWLNNSEDNKKTELLIMNQLWNIEKYLPGANWSKPSAAMFWKGLQGGQIDRQVSFQNHFPSLPVFIDMRPRFVPCLMLYFYLKGWIWPCLCWSPRKRPQISGD